MLRPRRLLRRAAAFAGAVLSVGLTSASCSRTGLDVPVGGGGGTTVASSSTGFCSAGTTVRAKGSPLDLYVMLDQSGSMSDPVAGGGTKWAAVTAAIQAFVEAPDDGGVSVGIQYFAVPPGGGSCPNTCKTNSDCGDACGECYHPFGGETGNCWNSITTFGDSCDSADYAVPEVEIGGLPGNAANIVASMANHSPISGTPTSAALSGAIDHAKSWAKTHPKHVVVDVLATDGDPTECDASLTNIDAIANAGVQGTPSIRTFVIGVGNSTSNLNGIAASGGTDHAYIVDTSADTNAQFLAALRAIRHILLACSYQIPLPASGKPDYSAVNVEYTPGSGGAAVVFDRVADAAQCPVNGNAWYYDNPKKPSEIILCKATCDAVSTDDLGHVDIVLGCQTMQ